MAFYESRWETNQVHYHALLLAIADHGLLSCKDI